MAELRPQEGGSLKRPKVLDYVGAGGMEKDEARQLAHDVVRHVRELSGREFEGEAPDPDTVRERRESRRRSRDAS